MIGYIDGARVCEDILVTHGEIEGLDLQSFEHSVMSDGFDIAHVTIKAVDEKGVYVPLSDVEITFEVEGGGCLKALGSGDLSSLEPSGGDTRKLYFGKALAIIQSNGSEKDIIITARHGSITSTLEILVEDKR